MSLVTATKTTTGDKTMTIKFNMYNVTAGANTVRCHYSLDNRADGRSCVTVYAKDFDNELSAIFGDSYKNDTDSMTDYFDKGRVVLFADHPLYATARAAVESINARLRAKWGKKVQRMAA